MEQHFRRATSRGIPKFSKIFFRKFSFHLTLLPENLEFSVEWFAFQKVNGFRNFWIFFRETSVPFRKFWLDGKRRVSTDQIYLYLCNKLPTEKLLQGAFKTILYPEEAERLTQISPERKSADKSLISFLILFHFI